MIQAAKSGRPISKIAHSKSVIDHFLQFFNLQESFQKDNSPISFNFKQISNEIVKILSRWTANVVFLLALFWILADTIWPQLKLHEQTALKTNKRVIYSIKGTLIYGLGWIVVAAIHQANHNDFMKILKAHNRDGFKNIMLFNIKVGALYVISLHMPINIHSNRFMAFLILYIWLSQDYVRTVLKYNWDSISKKQMHFVCNFSMNQGTSLVFIIAPMAEALLPEVRWLPGFLTLFPILARFTQCFIIGTHEQILNSIKFTLNLLGFGFLVVNMDIHSYYWRIAAAIYSFYWDVFRDWKWKQRFIERKNYRIDIPLIWFYLGLLYDIFGRSIWIFIPMSSEERGITEITRRLAWDLLRIQREQVYYFAKPSGNKVKDIYSN